MTYFDCTSAKSPDGKDKKQEWCYIDIYARDAKKWDYCKPIIDYDKVREKNQYELNVITVEARKVNAELLDLIGQAESAIRDLKAVRDGHAELDKKILLMTRATKATEYNLGNLYALENKWLQAEKEAIGIGKKIDKAEEELKKALKKKAHEKPKYYPTDKATMSKQENLFDEVINEKIQRRRKTDKVDCKGMDGYEKDDVGVGLKAEYFDNEAWVGKGKPKRDAQINFNWKGSSPISGINPYNFSVRWTGFLKAPFTGHYRFSIDTGDSVMVTFNDKVIIAHNMKTAVKESQSRNTNWMNSEIYMLQHPKKNRNKAISQQVYLIGGNKFK